MKKLNVINKNNFFNFDIFCENHPCTRYLKYKVIHFAAKIKLIMANKLPSTNLELFLRRIKSPLTR